MGAVSGAARLRVRRSCLSGIGFLLPGQDAVPALPRRAAVGGRAVAVAAALSLPVRAGDGALGVHLMAVGLGWPGLLLATLSDPVEMAGPDTLAAGLCLAAATALPVGGGTG